MYHTSQFPSFLVSRVLSKGYVSVPKGDAPVLLGHMIIASNNGCTHILSTYLSNIPSALYSEILTSSSAKRIYLIRIIIDSDIEKIMLKSIHK